MPRRQKLRSKSVGSYGCTVEIRERKVGGPLYLRVQKQWKSLRHNDWIEAEKEAWKLVARLKTAKSSIARKQAPFNVLFARYYEDVSQFKKGDQPKEDERRIAVWKAFFGEAFDARKATRNDLNRFIRLRRTGKLVVPGRDLSSRPSATTIGADIVFLLAVLRWAVDERLLRVCPIGRFTIPRTKNPAQPVASFDRFIRVYRHTRGLGLFREFFLLIGNELDWRVSALCQLKVNDIDFASSPDAPFGRLRKDPEADKEGMGGWVPMSFRAQRAARRAVKKRGAIGDVYLFESPKRPGRPWRRQHARDLLERAEALAKVAQLEGGDFHPYRRKWSSERQHHPWSHIAAVTHRKDRRTFERSYAKADAAGMLAVVNEPRQRREGKPAEVVTEVVARQA